jgi:hypothetical protein
MDEGVFAEARVQLAHYLGGDYGRSIRHASDRIRRAQCRLCLALGLFEIPLRGHRVAMDALVANHPG